MKDILQNHFHLFCLLPPLILAPLLWLRSSAGIIHWLAGLSGLPALMVAVFTPAPSFVDSPWMLLGTRFALDTISQVFLFFTAFVWSCSGVFAVSYFRQQHESRRRFLFFFILSMAGNLGVTIAADLASFYFFFSLMTFCGYGLVIHESNDVARQAARVYLKMSILGEMLLLCGFWLVSYQAPTLLIADIVAAQNDGPPRYLSLFFLLFGFGVKAGLFPVHVWLPLAHPVAPTPASAVLSGCMIKAGLLGWIRFLPLGLVELPKMGFALVLLGLFMSFGGVLVGLAQKSSKVVLAYSSISQMGLMTMLIGAGFTSRKSWPLALTAILIYSLHHAFAKSALFLGVGVAAKANRSFYHIINGLLGLAALSLTGAPLTGGALAKSSFKKAIALPATLWPFWLDWFLPLTAVGTTLLMGRFIFLVSKDSDKQSKTPNVARSSRNFELWIPWTILSTGALAGLWIIPFRYTLDVTLKWPFQWSDFIYSFWPILLGLVLIWRLQWLRHHREPHPIIKPGDILEIFQYVGSRLGATFSKAIHFITPKLRWPRQIPQAVSDRALQFVSAAESTLTQWTLAGTLFCLLVVVLWVSFSTMT